MNNFTVQKPQKTLHMKTANEYVFWIAYAALMMIIVAVVFILG